MRAINPSSNARIIPIDTLTIATIAKKLNFSREEDGCWNWRGNRNSGDGYGRVSLKGSNYRAHRFIYSLYHGNPPTNLVCDHLCRNRLCVNPKHIEMVTSVENFSRRRNFNLHKTHCKHGHEFTETNTYVWSGRRGCKQCIYNRGVRRENRDKNKGTS